MYKEILKAELEKEEEINLSLEGRVRRLGGFDMISEEKAEELCNRFDLIDKMSDEEKAYLEYKGLVEGLNKTLQMRAEIGEGHIGQALIYDTDGDEEYAHALNKIIEEHKNKLSALYPMAQKRADWLGVKLDTRWKRL